MTTKEQSQSGGTTEALDSQPPRLVPPLRTFKVRKYNTQGEMQETVIAAHFIEYSERGMVSFADAERNQNGDLALRVHNVVYHVEEVEEVIRIPAGARIITH